MSIIQGNNYDAHTRVRRRRRQIAGTRRARMSRRARSVLIITCICIITMFGGYLGVRQDVSGDIGVSAGTFAAEETVYEAVTIYSGDTIWGIAGDYSEPSQDVRKQIRAICELNDISPGDIYPGQTILVPIPAHMA